MRTAKPTSSAFPHLLFQISDIYPMGVQNDHPPRMVLAPEQLVLLVPINQNWMNARKVDAGAKA